MKKTKIVSTLGPASTDVDTIVKLINAGANIFRFNFSHGDHPEHLGRIENVHKAEEITGKHVGLMLDTKGAEIRTTVQKEGKINFEIGDKWAQVCGRPFDMVDCYGCEDAELIAVVMGSCAGNLRHVARELRAQGKKVGVARIRVYRPFPAEELAAALGSAKAVAVLDRSETYGGQMGKQSHWP